MKRIESFEVDHDKLTEGIYISRKDGDIITYDLRFKKPNTEFLRNDAIHTIEHLFATFVRNSANKDKIIYFGPMGCRTGFYFIVRDLSEEDTVSLIKDAVKFITEFDGEIPGTTKKECGNFAEHNLEEAKKAAKAYYEIIKQKVRTDLYC